MTRTCGGVATAPGLLLILLTRSSAVAQEAHWFAEFGFGQAATIDQARSWSGQRSSHMAVGRILRSTLSASVALSFDDLGYDVERLAGLFPADSIIEPRGSAQVLGVSAGVEWIHPLTRVLRPSLGVAAIYLHRKLVGFETSRYWLSCVFERDPAQVRRCSEYSRDLQISGDGVGLSGSAGMALAFREHEVGLQLRVARNLLGNSTGVLSGRLRYRYYF